MQQQPQVTEQTVPKVLIEFLVYVKKENEEATKKKLAILQNLMSESKKAKVLRILWTFDDGTKIEAEQKQWLIDNAVCRYYVLIEESDVFDKNFVKSKLNVIKKFESAVDGLKNNNIKLSKNKK